MNCDRIRRTVTHCEVCGRRGLIDPAHLFGRRNIVREPLASHPCFLIGLCRSCHDKIDTHQDDGLLERLRWDGLEELIDLLRLTNNPYPMRSPEWTAIDAAHWLDRCLASGELTNEAIYASVERL